MAFVSPVPAPTLVLFDWDNTLIDSFPLLHAASTYVRTALGYMPWSEAEARQNIRQAAKDIFPVLYGDRWPQAMELYYTYVAAHHLADLKPLSDAHALLCFLKSKGMDMGVVSNKRSHLLQAEIEHLGWGQFFKVTIGADDVLHGKPDPAGLQLALRVCDVLPQSAWYMGDTETDMQAAKAANVRAIYIENDKMCDEMAILQENPDLNFKNCTECLDYLRCIL